MEGGRESFQDLGEAGGWDFIRMAQVEMIGRADLIAFEFVVPEALLPAFRIHNADLNRRGEFAQLWIGGEGGDQLTGIGGAVGFEEKKSVGFMPVIEKDGSQFFAGAAADAAATDRGDGCGQLPEELGINPCILIIIEND